MLLAQREILSTKHRFEIPVVLCLCVSEKTKEAILRKLGVWRKSVIVGSTLSDHRTTITKNTSNASCTLNHHHHNHTNHCELKHTRYQSRAESSLPLFSTFPPLRQLSQPPLYILFQHCRRTLQNCSKTVRTKAGKLSHITEL